MADQQHDEPAVPSTPVGDELTTPDPIPAEAGASERRRLRRPSRRTTVAGVALGGVALAGFGGGYLVGHQTGGRTDQLQMTGFDRGDGHGVPPGGMPGGAPPGQHGQGGMGGRTGEQPDFDGDGQPDTSDGTTTPDDGASSSSSADDTSTT